MLPELAAIQTNRGLDASIPLLVTTGSPEENRRLIDESGIRCPVALQEDREVARLYGVHATPAGYLIDEGGAPLGPLAVGAEELLALARGDVVQVARRVGGRSDGRPKNGRERVTIWSASERAVRRSVSLGSPAPDFRLPRLDGEELSLSECRGRQTLLVFSDPDCEPCDRLLPELERLHRRAAGAQILVVSRGDPELNRRKAAKLGLTFPVLLQHRWDVSRQYGMCAAPIGYLISDEGDLVAGPAEGAHGILDLATASIGDSRMEDASISVF
jgi:peroxiredoxin